MYVYMHVCVFTVVYEVQGKDARHPDTVPMMSCVFLGFCVIGRLGRPSCCTRIFSRGLQGYLPHEYPSALN
jgi:hypothetical protein